MDEVKRLDVYVNELKPALSRSSAAKLVTDGRVSVNGRVQQKNGFKVRSGDEVIVDFDENQGQSTDGLDLSVIYEDGDCVVIYKPAGILSHSKGTYNPEETVATWLQSRWTGPANERAGIVHRLDRATSGVMICAKTPEAAAWLQKQFGQRKVKKIYNAVVSGIPKPPEAIIDMPIERNPKKPQTFRTGNNGKPAVTAYKTLASGSKMSLLELKPTTGRTHQLRVHMSGLGFPIVGDTLYSGAPGERLYLHASSLELTLPNKQRMTFEAKLPPEFNKIING